MRFDCNLPKLHEFGRSGRHDIQGEQGLEHGPIDDRNSLMRVRLSLADEGRADCASKEAAPGQRECISCGIRLHWLSTYQEKILEVSL
jgi:hypothetical protein